MIQNTLSVPLDVKPESAARLSLLIDNFKNTEDKLPADEASNFAHLINDVPSLHFMSMSVFENQAYDPVFLIEANFDGQCGPFWAQLEALAGDRIREMLRCCKKPLDGDGALFENVTEKNSEASVAPYLEARTQKPSVFHHGNRGLSRDRILNEAKLFRAIREELDAPLHQGPEPYRGISPKIFWQRLRKRMEPDYPWLELPSPKRVTTGQRLRDFLRLLLFVTFILFIFALPGIIAAVLFPLHIYVGGIIILAVIVIILVVRLMEPLPGTDVRTDFNLMRFLFRSLPTIALIVIPTFAVLIVMGLVIVTAIDFFTHLVPGGFEDWWWPVARTILLGQLGFIFTIPGVVLWLRFLEKRDSSQDEPPIDEDMIAKMARHEDWVSQNHMASIVHIRPGVVRTLIVKAGHQGLGLLLRFTATDGYLGSMRTVHFAHWAFLNNSSRLLFVSNFDQGWGAYLDDFIEKAHVGLTLAWGCSVGFPATRFLIFDGASHGRRFKNWALASRTVSRFWYSAYPELTVDQIERNHRVALGLRKESMTEQEIKQWMREL